MVQDLVVYIERLLKITPETVEEAGFENSMRAFD